VLAQTRQGNTRQLHSVNPRLSGKDGWEVLLVFIRKVFDYFCCICHDKTLVKAGVMSNYLAITAKRYQLRYCLGGTGSLINIGLCNVGELNDQRGNFALGIYKRRERIKDF
jgi:hypothetical protein